MTTVNIKSVYNLRERLNFEVLDGILLGSLSNIFYYSGFTGEDSWLLVTKDKIFLLTDGRFIEQSVEQCPNAVVLVREGGTTLAKLFSDVCWQYNLKKIAFESSFFSYNQHQDLLQTLQKENVKTILSPNGGFLPLPRMVKDKAEIEIMMEAAAIGDKVFADIKRILQPGVTEKTIAQEINIAFYRNGAEGLSFPTIVAAGVNGAKPHAHPSDYMLSPGDFVVMDFGCVYKGYCSDMTRTVAIGDPRDFEPEQLEAYQIVLQAQQYAVEHIKPGMTGIEADKLARNIIEGAGYGRYFTHSLGHGVGINVHESPTLSPSSKDILQVGNVVTVEPGIYIPGKGGIRIEDTGIITVTGFKRITNSGKELEFFAKKL